MRNLKRFKFKLEKDGTLEELEQRLRVRAQATRPEQEVRAQFEADEDRTEIEVREPRPRQELVRPGLVLLRLATREGILIVEVP